MANYEQSVDDVFLDEVFSKIRGVLTSAGVPTLPERLERNPFKVLIATILSQRTKDEVTVESAKRLFSRYGSVKQLANAKVEDVERLIKPVGFYRVKAKRIVDVARMLESKHGGEVPDDIEILLTLPLVGRKTANAVLAFGFRKDALVIDTHAHRILNRIGIVKTKTPDQTEMELRKTVNKRYWSLINDMLVPFGKIVCKPIKPECETCEVSGLCDHYVRQTRELSGL